MLAPKALGVPLGDHSDEAFAEVAFVARCLTEVRRVGALAPQSRAMVARTIRLFELARTLGVTTFHPSEHVKALGRTLMAIGADWAGRDDYLQWCERWPREEPDIWWTLDSSPSQLAMRIGLFLRGGGESPSTGLLAETALNGADRVERITAAGLLVDRAGRDTSSWEPVAQCLRHEQEEEVRTALMARLRYDEDVDHGWVARLAVELLGDADTEVRQAALGCLQLHRIATPEARAALDRLFGDPDPRVRESVLRPLALHAEDGARAMELLRPALEDADPEVRAAALSAVVKRTGDERVVRDLVQELLRNDGSPEVTVAAINAVREIGSDDPGMHAHLCELAGREDIAVRWAALRCLAEGGIPAGPLADLFTRRLKHDDFGWIRQYGLDLFVVNGEDETLVRDFLLDRCRNDPSPEVQSHALMWLGMGDPEAARVLAFDLARNHPDNHARASVVGYLLTECGDVDEAVRLVHDLAVNDEDGAVRAAALHELRTRRSGPELAALAGDRFDHDPDPTVRHAALGILADLRRDDPDLIPLLRRAAETDGEEQPRDLANRLLAVLAPQPTRPTRPPQSPRQSPQPPA
ncbi:HEAT repeat domain-containing protein [Streptomyces narbonensis]